MAWPGILEFATGLAAQPAVAMREQKNFLSAPKQNARAQQPAIARVKCGCEVSIGRGEACGHVGGAALRPPF